MNAIGIAQGIRGRPWLAYPCGAFIGLAGFAVRELLMPGLTGAPFITFLPAVVIAALLAGLGPALLCAVIGAAIAALLYIERDPALTLTLYAIVAAAVSTSIP